MYGLGFFGVGEIGGLFSGFPKVGHCDKHTKEATSYFPGIKGKKGKVGGLSKRYSYVLINGLPRINAARRFSSRRAPREVVVLTARAGKLKGIANGR